MARRSTADLVQEQVAAILMATCQEIMKGGVKRYSVRERGCEHITDQLKVVELCADMKHLEQEQFRVLVLNTKLEVMEMVTLYQGTIDACTIRVAECFKHAIRLNGRSIIVVHNHPSGYSDPSLDDDSLTRSLVEAGKILGISVLDHVIVATHGHDSAKTRGIIQ